MKQRAFLAIGTIVLCAGLLAGCGKVTKSVEINYGETYKIEDEKLEGKENLTWESADAEFSAGAACRGEFTDSLSDYLAGAAGSVDGERGLGARLSVSAAASGGGFADGDGCEDKNIGYGTDWHHLRQYTGLRGRGR